MDKYQCNSNLLEIEDESITMQELSNSIEEIVNTPDIYLIFKPPDVYANIEYATTNHDIFNEVVNNNVELMSSRNFSKESSLTLDNLGSIVSDNDINMNQEFSNINEHQIVKKPLSDTKLKTNNHKHLLSLSAHTTKEEMKTEISIKNTPKIIKRNNKNYSSLIQMYCTKCNKVSINYFDTKCEDCQTLLLFQCAACHYLFKRLITIHNHIKYECYKGSVFYCNECKFESAYKIQLIKHIHLEHSALVGSKVFTCSVCQKKFRNQNNMVSHERVCSKYLILKCRYCQFKTKFSSVLKKHIQLKHQIFNKRNYHCPDCGKKYELLKNLNRHIIKLCGKKLKFECDHCDYTINRKHFLAKHIQQNHSELYFKSKLFCGL